MNEYRLKFGNDVDFSTFFALYVSIRVEEENRESETTVTTDTMGTGTGGTSGTTQSILSGEVTHTGQTTRMEDTRSTRSPSLEHLAPLRGVEPALQADPLRQLEQMGQFRTLADLGELSDLGGLHEMVSRASMQAMENLFNDMIINRRE